MNPSPPAGPLVSVIVLNYNGARWLDRCLKSIRAQTIFDKSEIIVADNNSPDGSDRMAAEIMQGWPDARVIQHGENLGYCEGNNRAAAQARGTYLLFLNNDTWLEPTYLEAFLAETARAHACAATPLVMNYDDDSFQSLGASGFDIFGLITLFQSHADTREVFMPDGCSYLIQRELFEKLGGFDNKLFMFADEADLSWRVWISGERAVAVPSARMHHRSGANVNPAGGGTMAEYRTSDTKRYFANRNSLVLLLKNARNILLLLVFLQLCMLAAEAVVGLFLVRRWSFVKRAYLDAVKDCWGLRHHILAERRRIRGFRRRGDFWMLRFLRLRPNRWAELQRVRQSGIPRVTPA
jgi:GT2 family glycosyltransferase